MYAGAFVSYLQFLQKDVWWTVMYVIFLIWMYLFHAPFRVNSVWRTDWYAQVTKVLQIWIGVDIFLFHACPRFFESKQFVRDVANTTDEDAVATLFFPIFSTTTLIILYLHNSASRWGLGVTYGSNVTITVLNSLLLSLFSTMHFAYGLQILDFERSSWLTSAVGVVFPSSEQSLLPTLLLLCVINILFMALDYRYKRSCGFDPLRGLLWCEVCDHGVVHEEVVAVSETDDDWRKSEPKPRQVVKDEQLWLTSDADGRKLNFALSGEEMRQLSVLHPVNRPGMVPWFSTFIAGTALQSVIGNSLNFLTFDQRAVEQQTTPKVFKLSFTRATLKTDNSMYSSSSADVFSSSTTDAACVDRDDREDVWFDFVADVGDGFNSTYEIARLMALPVLCLSSEESTRFSQEAQEGSGTSLARSRRKGNLTPPLGHVADRFTSPAGGGKLQAMSARSLSLSGFVPTTDFVLPRASFVIIGGDLAYPNPTNETYRTRLLEPYNDAIRRCTPLCEMVKKYYNHLVVQNPENKDEVHIRMLAARKVEAMTQHNKLTDEKITEEGVLRSIPMLFAIPGNHDWLDGLVTFKKFIIDESWLGGWFMPQKSSYFVIQLPYNWFILCMDTGNEADIDPSQRNYFLDYTEKTLDELSCVVLVSHEPGWVYEAMRTDLTSTMQPELNRVVNALGTRLRLRLCGDIHHYSRHTPTDPFSEAPVLVVSGGGGAFLHGSRNTPVISQGTEYKRVAAFPRHNHVTSFLARLVGFRLINWKFDIIAGFMSFGLIASSLPLNMQDEKLKEIVDIYALASSTLFRTVELFFFTFDKGIVSLFVALCFFASFFSLGSGRKGLCFRVVYATLWTVLVVLASTGMLSIIQTTLAYMMNHQLVSSTKEKWSGVLVVHVCNAVNEITDQVLGWLGDQHFVSRGIVGTRLAARASRLVEVGRTALQGLDITENLAYLSHQVGTNNTGSISHSADRIHVILYYLHILLIYWLLAAPLLSFIFGIFLFVSVHYFDLAYDASYSSFQIEDYKHFVRFCVDAKTRVLHGYVIAETYVPKIWSLDGRYVAECTDAEMQHLPPHLRKHPSRWIRRGEAGPSSAPRVLENFVVKPHRVTSRNPKGSRVAERSTVP